MPHTLYHFSLPTRYVSIAFIHHSHFLSPFTSLTFTFSRVSQGVPGCQLIEIKISSRGRGLIQIISNLSKWESLKQKPLPLATCYCCHDLLQFEIIWKVPTPLILISIRNFFLGHSVLLHKGSHPLRKVQFFWTLFKRPLTPPPFRLNICPILQGVFFKMRFCREWKFDIMYLFHPQISPSMPQKSLFMKISCC